MEDNDFQKLQKQVLELSEKLDELNFSFYKKLGSGSKTITGSELKSDNFVTGSAGWRLTPTGDLEANDGTFRGTLEANAINIPNSTNNNSFHTDTNGNSWWGCNNADFTSDNDNADAYILNTGVAKIGTSNGYFQFDGTNSIYSGNIKHSYTAGENISPGKMVCLKNATTDVSSTATTTYIKCAYVNSAAADTNYHDLATMYTGTNGGTVYELYIKVDVDNISQYIERAVLRLNLNTPPATGTTKILIKRITSDWTYDTVTYNTKPTHDDTFAWEAINAGGSGVKEFDITQLVRAWKNKSLGGTGYDNYGVLIEIDEAEYAVFNGQSEGTVPVYRRIEDGSSDGKVYLTDDDEFNLVRNFVGVSAATATANASLMVYDAFGNPLTGNLVSSLVAGMPVYLSNSPGAYTQTATNTKYATLIGYGRANGEILLNPEKPYLVEQFPPYFVNDCKTGITGIQYLNLRSSGTLYVFPPVDAIKCVIYFYGKDDSGKLGNGSITVYKVGQTQDEWYGGGTINTTSSMFAEWIGDVITITAGAEWNISLSDYYPKINVCFYSK